MRRRKLDGIYVMVRDGRFRKTLCLSDMTEEQLHEALADKDVDWMEDAIIHLANKLREAGDAFDIEGEHILIRGR